MVRLPEATARQFERALADHPELLAALDEVHDAAWSSVPADLLDLCRLRVAMLLGHSATTDADDVDRALLAELPRWPDSPRFSPTERAALAFTEQFVIDVASMSDDLVEAMETHLGAGGALEFTNALLVIEQRQRLALLWSRLLPEVVE
jgi:alkylhydroperoxidase family enzyme